MRDAAITARVESSVKAALAALAKEDGRSESQYLGRVDGFGQDEACDERDEGSKVSLCLLAA